MSEESSFEQAPLSHGIFRVARLHKGLAARLLRDSGLRPGQELVLLTLWQEGPQRQVDLVEALDSDAPTMARSIARLEKVGLIRRRRSATDKRAMIVEATEASLVLRPKVQGAWADLERYTVGQMSPGRRDQMLEMFAELEGILLAVDGLGEQ